MNRPSRLPWMLIGLGLMNAGFIGNCGSSDEELGGELGSSTGGGSATAGSGNSTSAGTGGQGGSIDIGPDASADAYDPEKPFAPLCANEGCVPGRRTEQVCDTGYGGGGTYQPDDEMRSCKLLPGEDGPIGVCSQLSSNSTNDICAKATDCADGTGCEATSLKCRQYCCGDVELCPEKTYCSPEMMAEDSSDNPSLIPMCVPVKDCVLLDDSTCGAGETCSVVREDGTTSCIPIGPGEACDDCPCAPGFVCSKATNKCLRLCHIDQGCPDDGFCQSGSMNYPEDIGVCVGGKLDCR